MSAQLLVMTAWDQSAQLNSGACQLQCHTTEYVTNERISTTLHNDAVSSRVFYTASFESLSRNDAVSSAQLVNRIE